ncbi:MAG: HpcH/HpaI aldolase/citrate lyase family protein [Burkholderiales bacterium]
MLPNPRRCLLFVPGSRPDRFDKALASDADQVCIDLEDAVPLADKATARRATLDFIAAAGPLRSELGLRVNNAMTELGRADLVAISSGGFRPAFVMLPKVESADEILAVLAVLNDAEIPLIAQLESPHAVFEARAIANATRQLQALMFGGFDYAVAARIKPGYDGWLWARGMIAAAAAEAEIGAIDVPSLEIKDVPEVALDTQRVMDLGFTGKSAIHPAQVDVIQRAFLPTSHELAHAEKVVAAMKAADGAAIAVDGKLVDRPIELAAIRVMDLAKLGLRDTDANLAKVA